MELLSQFNLNPYRIYNVSKRTNKGIATFPTKTVSTYLDYSVDFSRKLQDDERILSGSVAITNGIGLTIEAVVCNGPYLTAFISGGNSNNNYYLTFEAQTNLGGLFIQDLILPVIGKSEDKQEKYSFFSFTEKIKPPNTRPPLNAIKINDRYLLNDSGFFMGI